VSNLSIKSAFPVAMTHTLHANLTEAARTSICYSPLVMPVSNWWKRKRNATFRLFLQRMFWELCYQKCLWFWNRGILWNANVKRTINVVLQLSKSVIKKSPQTQF